MLNVLAHEVAEDLEREGVSEGDIHISSRIAAEEAGIPEHHRRGFISWLEGLFGAGEPEEEVSRYENAVNRGKLVVAVETDRSSQDHAIRGGGGCGTRAGVCGIACWN